MKTGKFKVEQIIKILKENEAGVKSSRFVPQIRIFQMQHFTTGVQNMAGWKYRMQKD